MKKRRLLTISLYPLIPDAGGDLYKNYLKRLTSEFEALHPDIRLKLQMGMEYSTSNPQYLKKAFSENLIDAAEVDSLNLSYIVSNNWATNVTEFYKNNDENLYPQAIESFTINGKVYGHPSALCTSVLFSRNKKILEAKNISQLLAFLEDNSKPKILSTFLGPGVMPIYYGLFHLGAHGLKNRERIMSLPLDHAVLDTMKEAIKDCIYFTFKDIPKDLTDYSHTDPYWPVYDYVEGKCHSFLGFSENLHHLMRLGKDEPFYYVSDVFGNKIHALFANGFVTNKIGISPQREQDVLSFAQYFRSVKTALWRGLSEDAGGYPRYLLPVRRDFFEEKKIKKDKYYKSFEWILENGIVFANSGFIENQKKVTTSAHKYFYKELKK